MSAPVLIGKDGDLGAVLDVIRAAFAEQKGLIDPPSSMNKLSVLDIKKHLETDVVWSVLERDTLVACLFGTAQGNVLYLSKLSVDPNARGRGIAACLMGKAESHARQYRFEALEVIGRVELTQNHAMFERFGYSKFAEGRHEGYDRTTEIHFRKPVERVS